MSEQTNIVCVKCTSVLDKATFMELEVDLCPKCGGLWLDRGEIVRASKLPDDELGRLRSLLTGSSGPPPVPSVRKADCPACEGELKEVVLGKVHVDYCGTCHGIFLDRGELEDAVEAIKAKNQQASTGEVIAAAIQSAPR